jgi:hypothetical protein
MNSCFHWFFGLPNIKHYKISNLEKKDFLFNHHINKFKKMLFTNNQSREVDIVNKNWPNDPIVGYKLLFNLVE